MSGGSALGFSPLMAGWEAERARPQKNHCNRGAVDDGSIPPDEQSRFVVNNA